LAGKNVREPGIACAAWPLSGKTRRKTGAAVAYDR